MLTIRLSRKGQKNRPMYRLVISEKSKDTYDKPLEFLGSYNPYSKELNIEAERIKYWLSQGAGMSPTINNLLISQNIIEGKKVRASGSSKKKKAGKDSKSNTDTSQTAPSPEAKPTEEKLSPSEEAKTEVSQGEVESEKKETKQEEKSETDKS